MNADTSTTTHEGLRVVEYGRTRFVVEVKVNEDGRDRSITVLCAPGLVRIADALAWKVGESLGWKMHGGGSSSFWGPASGAETGNGRYHVTASAYPAPKTAPKRTRAPKIHAIVGHRVNVKLYDHETTNDVFWSERCNSYVLAAAQPHERGAIKVGEAHATLVSVNGAGEVRWTVQQGQIDSALRLEADGIRGGDAEEQLAAARHFGLIPAVGAQSCFGRAS